METLHLVEDWTDEAPAEQQARALRRLAATELTRMLEVLGHPVRLQLVEELSRGERDVRSLVEALGVASSGVSQHLQRLRAQRLVAERREGRHTYYRLQDPALAGWLTEGLRFVVAHLERTEEVGRAVRQALNAGRAAS